MDFTSLGITGVAAITAICYFIGVFAKASELDDKWVPVICGVSGLILGIVSMFVMPDFPATDYVTAGAVGIASGFAATGIHQVFKQNEKAKGRDDDE